MLEFLAAVLDRPGGNDRCCTAHRKHLFARSLRAARSSPWRSILLPPTARNRSRWWHRRESPASRIYGDPETKRANCHRDAKTSRATVAVVAGWVKAPPDGSGFAPGTISVPDTLQPSQAGIPATVPKGADIVGCFSLLRYRLHPTFVPLTVAKTAVFFLRLYARHLRMLFGPEGRCGKNAGVVIPGNSR